MATRPDHVLLSRTDSIGDVVLTLPVAGMLKRGMPGVRVTFLGRVYTAPLLRQCAHVDEVLTFEELQDAGDDGAVRILKERAPNAVVHVFPQPTVAHWCRRAGIPMRVGTSRRPWHWITCNRLVHGGRRKSDLHEAQLNTKLLRPFGFTDVPSLTELASLSGLYAPALDASIRLHLDPARRKVILHPLSKGSAVEWGLDRFAELIGRLDRSTWQVIVTGTATEAERYRPHLPLDPSHAWDAGGTLSLSQLIALIGSCDALVAASTGPLHIAAALGKRAIGLYASERPLHPGRWAPVGRDAHALTTEMPGAAVDAASQVRSITPQQVLRVLERPW